MRTMRTAFSLESLRSWGRVSFMLAMFAGAALIAYASVSYFTDGDTHPFILDKEPLKLEGLYIAALHVHVASALFALPACTALLSRTLLRRLPRVHRWLGRTAGLVVVAALVPSGAWLSFSARGGAPSTVGFLVSGAIAFVATVLGVVHARNKDFAAHRRAMLHVVAQMSVAVTSRALLFACAHFRIDNDAAYIAALWLPVVVSAVVAELTVPRRSHASPARRFVLDPAR